MSLSYVWRGGDKVLTDQRSRGIPILLFFVIMHQQAHDMNVDETHLYSTYRVLSGAADHDTARSPGMIMSDQ